MRALNLGFVAGFAVVAALAVRPAAAMSTFSAQAFAAITLSSNSNGGLADLGYLGSQARYGASAQASFDEGVRVDLDDGVVNKSATPPISFGAVVAGGPIGDLFLKPTDKPIVYGAVDAMSDEAEGHGRSGNASSGASFELSANVNGQATDTGDLAFGNAKVRWDLLVTFQNISNEALIATWTVNHILSAAAMADPRGTAYAQSTFSGSGAPDVANAAADPPIPPNPDNMAGVGPNPPALSGTTRFHFSLAPQQIKSFEFALEATGNARITPLPAAGPLLLSALAFVALAARRRRTRADR